MPETRRGWAKPRERRDSLLVGWCLAPYRYPFLGDSAAIGLLTRLGPIDVVLAPRGFEEGYIALVGRSEAMRVGGLEVRVGALADLVRSKELLRRAKDVEHLAVLYEAHPELSAGSDEPPA